MHNPRATTAGMMSMSALCEVHRWYMIHPTQTPLTIATSLRLFSAADDYIGWAQEFMRATSSTSLKAEAVLAGYRVTAMHFHSLFTTPARIMQTLAKRGDMLDLAIRLWVAVCDGLPIMYADGMQNPKATRDSGMVVFRELTKENPEGMARAIMGAGICTPQAFVERTVGRARCLVRLNQMRHLSHLPNATPLHTRENFLTLLDVTQRLRAADAGLRKIFKKQRVLNVFMEVLEQVQKAVPDRPARPEDTEKGRADGMLEMLELVLDWVLCTSADMVDNLKLVIDDGFLRLLADSVRFAHERGSRFTYVTKYLIGYATYPKVLTALLPGLNSQIVPKAVHLRSGGQAQAYLSGLIIGLEPLRKSIPDDCQVGLCDSLSVSCNPMFYFSMLIRWDISIRHAPHV